MKADYYNLRAALSWAVIERQDAIASLRLTGSLPWFWYFTGQFSEGRGWNKLALALPGADTAIAARAKVLSGEARLAAYSGAMPTRLRQAMRASICFAERTTVPDWPSPCFISAFGGRWHANEKKPASAWRRRPDIFAISTMRGKSPSPRAITGWRLRPAPGFEEEASRLLTEGRARGQALGDDWVVTLSSHYLGSIALRQGDYGLARKLTEECSRAHARWVTIFAYRATSTSFPRSRWPSIS